MKKADKRPETNRKRTKTVQKYCSEPCPIERGMRLIGGKMERFDLMASQRRAYSIQ